MPGPERVWAAAYPWRSVLLLPGNARVLDAARMAVNYPIALPYAGWKRHLILGAGRALVNVFPGTASRFKSGELPQQPTRWDRLLLAGLVDEHMRSGRLEELTALHDWVWRGDLAVAFHARAEARFRDVFLPYHAGIVPALDAAIRQTGGDYLQVCEIGCGCGLVLQHLSRELQGPRDYLGLDLSARQVQINRERFAGEPLRFEAADGFAWVLEQARPHTVFLTYGGVLEYFPQRRVAALLSWIAGAAAPALVALVEPLADQHDADADPRSLPFGVENTFSHPYPRLLREAGLEPLWRAETVVRQQRWLMIVAHAAPPVAARAAN